MKRSFIAIALAALTLSATAGEAALRDDVSIRPVMDDLMDKVASALGTSAIPKDKPVAILPLPGDTDGMLANRLKIALTKAGLNCVEGKEDPMWDAILKEIEWDARKGDILDAATLDKFGRLKSAKTLLYGFARIWTFGGVAAWAEAELHATSIETKQHVWGETVTAWNATTGGYVLAVCLAVGFVVLSLLVRKFLRAATRVR